MTLQQAQAIVKRTEETVEEIITFLDEMDYVETDTTLDDTLLDDIMDKLNKENK